ncbi:hypothetical protein NX059_004004 [Plenodomus lindquistii]|nr:hypothetical protein NX059_004004 [Plenodomus lindquistii]
MRFWSILLVAGMASAGVVKGNDYSTKPTPKPLHDSPKPLAQVAETQYVNINGSKLAYRRFGKRHGNPVVYMTHFRGVMDKTDPLLFNYIAQYREVILFDNTGVGRSEGVIPSAVESMGDATVALVKALDIEKAVFLGFSLGGMIAQYISFTYPEMVEKAVFAGTAPGANANFSAPDPAVFEAASVQRVPTVEDFLFLFFSPTNTSRAAGQDWWKRLSERRIEREQASDFILGAGVGAQATALGAFISNPENFEKLKTVKAEVLVTNGKSDILLPTPNSFFMQQALPYAYLDIYPDSGHAHLFQFPKQYAERLREFLQN